MPIVCCIGEAAGTAAALAAASGRQVGGIDIKSLQAELEKNGAIIK